MPRSDPHERRGDRPRVVLLRGHEANPWELGPYAELRDRFDLSVLVTSSNRYDVSRLALDRRAVRSRRDLLPSGRLGDAALAILGDGYRKLEQHLRGAAIVHVAEIESWFAAQAARLRPKLGFRLASLVWETIPLLESYRTFDFTRRTRGRAYRCEILEQTDLFLPASHRARDALLLEGVPPERVVVCEPGVDLTRFRPTDADPAPGSHVVLSAGRLVWEKGHQDAIRAIAALHRGIVPGPGGATPRLVLVGRGPEQARLRAYADELGVGDLVELRGGVGYDAMPELYRQASCLVLASLPVRWWEEQFGMVLAEAMASGLPIVASSSGAIPEVLGGVGQLFAPGDWLGLARLLADGPLAQTPGRRDEAGPGRAARFSTSAAAARLVDAFETLLSAA